MTRKSLAKRKLTDAERHNRFVAMAQQLRSPRLAADPAILPHTHVASGSAKRLFEFCNRAKFAPRHQR
jgi:hypothetical protein